jgi:iron complex transport system permease protein
VKKKSVWILFIVLLVVLIASLLMGRFTISLIELQDILISKIKGKDSMYEAAASVFWQSRLPRVLAAAFIGCGLSVSGAAYQGIFRNPMVSSDLLGASAGAGFGAALGFLLGKGLITVEIMAFISGMLAVMLTWAVHQGISRKTEGTMVLLVLSGIVINSFFQALISIVKYTADPYDTMPSITFWLMGGLNYVVSEQTCFLIVVVLMGLLPLLLCRWRLNLLSFGGEEAAAMGVNVKKYQVIVVFCATLMTAACIAVGGMIGWVGLIIPHFARMIAGPDYYKMLPLCAVIGAIFMMIVDDISRCMFAQEIPIGVLTAFIGAPIFIYLLASGKRGFLT